MNSQYDPATAPVYNVRVIATLPRLAPPTDDYSIDAELTVPTSWRGWGWPESLTVTWTDDGVTFRLEGTMTSDGPRLRSVSLVGADIRPDHLRRPLNTALRNAFAAAAHGPRQDGGYTRKAGFVLRVPVGVGRPIDVTSARQRLDEVAAIHKNTPRGGKGQAVADAFGVSMSYARSLITEARRAGLIESPHDQGTASTPGS